MTVTNDNTQRKKSQYLAGTSVPFFCDYVNASVHFKQYSKISRLFFERNRRFLAGQNPLDVGPVLDDHRGADQRGHDGRHHDIEQRQAVLPVIDKIGDEKCGERVKQAAADRRERDRLFPSEYDRKKRKADQEHAPVQHEHHGGCGHDALAAAEAEVQRVHMPDDAAEARRIHAEARENRVDAV